MDKAGYVLWKRRFMRYGIDPCLDVQRLSDAWGRPVRTIFDVGAHEGEMRRELLAAFPGADVHSFEPHPASFQRLEAANPGCPQLLHKLALSDRVGPAALYDYGPSGDGSEMNSLVPNAGFAVRTEFPASKIAVECSTVDTFCDQHGIGRIDLLKIDVEGHDLAVIQGAEQMLREGRIGFVYAEFNDLLDREGVAGGSLLPMATFLEPLGLRYIATYTDRVEAEPPLWVSANVLFAAQGKS